MSKLIITLIFAIELNAQTFGQSHTPALLDSLCNETIQFYYSEFSGSHDSVRNSNYPSQIIYLSKSDKTQNLKTQFDKFKVRYVTQEEILEDIVKASRRTGTLAEISIHQYNDTVDIDISDIAITIKNFRFVNDMPKDIEATFEIGCGGTLGYIPTCRFIYNKTSNRWTKYTWTEIVDQKLTSGN